MAQFDTPDYSSLQKTRDWLRISAPIVRGACWLIGALMFAEKALLLLSTGYGLGQRIELGVHALVWLGGAAVVGVMLARTMTAASDLIDVRIDSAVVNQQILAILRDELVPMLSRTADSSRGSQPADLSNLTTAELLEQLHDAKRMGEADDILDLRDSLQPRLPQHKRESLDAELAEWFTRYFEKALRSGKAPMVAATLGRAVEQFAEAPGMEHLSAALPMVRQSAGLCAGCGKPYRGGAPVCPACSQAEEDFSTEDAEEDQP